MATAPDDRWLDLVADLLDRPLTRLPDVEIGALLVETFDCAGGTFHSRTAPDVEVTSMWPRAHYAPFGADIAAWARRWAPTRHPLLRYYRATGDVGCVQVADVPEAIACRAVVDGWRALGRQWGGIRAQVAIPLVVGAAGHRSFVLDRADPFTPAEMAALRRLQRLLVGLDRQVQTYARAQRRPAPPGGAPPFTPREAAVLELLSQGLTAAAIGRRLHIAERTVQKHLQRIYAKLGVGDRLSAVQRSAHLRTT